MRRTAASRPERPVDSLSPPWFPVLPLLVGLVLVLRVLRDWARRGGRPAVVAERRLLRTGALPTDDDPAAARTRLEHRRSEVVRDGWQGGGTAAAFLLLEVSSLATGHHPSGQNQCIAPSGVVVGAAAVVRAGILVPRIRRLLGAPGTPTTD